MSLFRRISLLAVAALAVAVVLFTPTAAAYMFPIMPAAQTVMVERSAYREAVTEDAALLIKRPNGLGSAVYIGHGRIVTAAHVVVGAKVVSLKSSDGRISSASVVAIDEKTDLAILQTNMRLLPANLSCAAVPVGTPIVAIGNPLGQEFDRSVTIGVVSAYDRSIQGSGNDRYGRRTTVTNSMIQTDAAISSGNSGGGMFNMLGQLQGIPTLKYDSSPSIYSNSPSIDNIGMCVPINTAKPLIRQALEQYNADTVQAAKIEDKDAEAAADEDTLNRPRLGITVGTLNPSFSASVSGGLPNGAYVREVEAGSPAEKAGLQPGDIIVEVNETIITDQQVLIDTLSGFKEGDKVDLTYFRAPGLAQVVDGSADVSTVQEGDYTSAELKIISKSL